MKTKKIDAFDAIKTLKEELSKHIKVGHIQLVFDDNEKNKSMEAIVFYEKDGDTANHFFSTIYSFNSNLCFEELLSKCIDKVKSINPESITKITVNL